MITNTPPSSSPLAKIHEALEAERGSAYLLAPDLTIRWVNEGWRRFARENGAPELASSWAAVGPVSQYVAPGLREPFEARYLRVLADQTPWSQVYECSSALIYRKFNVQVQSVAGWHGFTVVHSLVTEASLPRAGALFDDRMASFTDAHGLLVACSACGRLKLADGLGWEWVPGLLKPENDDVSHGICGICELQYYG